MERAKRISGRLQVERMDDGCRVLLRDLSIDLKTTLELGDFVHRHITTQPTAHTVVTVPEGFETDFSSIPGFARALYRFDSVDLAGCCHDYGYYIGMPRKAADEVWRLVAISGERRIDRVRGRLGWLALRVGGWFAYRSHARRRAQRLGAAGPDIGRDDPPQQPMAA